MSKIIVVNKKDTLILHARCRMTKESIEREVKWFKEVMGIKVKIIDATYGIAGIEEHGKGVR